MARRKSSLTLATAFLAVNVVDAYWRMSCSVIETGRIDPVVSYNSASSHVHKISGGSNININSTYESLRESTCTSCSIQADLSAYWTPQFYYSHANGTYEEVPNGGMAVYYLGRGVGADGSGAIPFPEGLQMFSGNSAARAYDNATLTWGNATYPPRPVSDRVSFVCIGNDASPQSVNITSINCPDGLRAQIQMQSCWDGTNLASPTQSHVAYLSQIDNGACPPTHPYLLPHLFYEVLYSMDQIDQSDGGHYIFSNGDTTGYGFHGDFLNGWDIPTLQAGINQCLINNTDGVVEECAAFSTSNNDSYATYCTECSPVFPCEPVHGLIPSLPGCSTSYSTGITSCPGGPAACAANYNTYGTQMYAGNSQFTSMGCYTDQGGSRTLTGKSFGQNQSLTVEGCLQYCQGYQYAGVEYGQECYCGNSIASTGATTNSSACNMDCTGSRLEWCGGPNAINLYQAIGSSSSASSSSSSSTTIRSTATSLSSSTSTSSTSTSSTATSSTATSSTAKSSTAKSSTAASSTAASSTSSSAASSTTASSTPTTMVTQASSTTTSTASATPTTVHIVPGDNSFTYYACVNERAGGGRALPTQLNTASTIEACLSAAAVGPYSWAGIEYGGQCFVGSFSSLNQTTSPNASSTACQMTCNSSPLEICGGPNLLTMYTRTSPLPPQPSVYPATALNDTYLGCYAEPSGSRVLQTFTYAWIAQDNMTVEYCLKSAKTAGYKYAGVEYGRECWVGNAINPSSGNATNQADCDMVCGGNALEFCGAGNRLNLYQLS